MIDVATACCVYVCVCGCGCVWLITNFGPDDYLAQLGMNLLPLEDSSAPYSFFFQPQAFSNMAETRSFKMEGT